MKKSFEITLSGVSAALTIICIVLSYYLPVMTLTFHALSGIMLMLPLVIKSGRGAILTYIASIILGFLFTNILAILPFAFIFGSGTLVMYFCSKYLNKKWFFIIPVKIIFINLGLFGIYKLIGFGAFAAAFNRIGINPNYFWAALIATPVYIIYDYLLQNLFKYIRQRMRKIFKNQIPQDKE